MHRSRLTALRATLVVAVALVAQVGVVADLQVAGAVGDVMLLVTVAAALTGGADRGATYGFATGLVFDLVLDSPFALSALTYALVGYGIGLVWRGWFRPTGLWPLAIAGLAGAAAATIYTGIGHLIDAPYPWHDLPAVTLAVGLWNAALVLPAMAALRWVHGSPEPDRLEVALR